MSSALFSKYYRFLHFSPVRECKRSEKECPLLLLLSVHAVFAIVNTIWYHDHLHIPRYHSAQFMRFTYRLCGINHRPLSLPGMLFALFMSQEQCITLDSMLGCYNSPSKTLFSHRFWRYREEATPHFWEEPGSMFQIIHQKDNDSTYL